MLKTMVPLTEMGCEMNWLFALLSFYLNYARVVLIYKWEYRSKQTNGPHKCCQSSI